MRIPLSTDIMKKLNICKIGMLSFNLKNKNACHIYLASTRVIYVV